MSKTILILNAFLTGAALWGQQQVDPGALAPVGLTSGQTLRINVSARTSGSCAAQLGFLDSDGKPLGPSSSVSLKGGESASLELPSGLIAVKPGQRVEIRPRLVLGPSTIPSACQTSVSVREAKEAKPAGGTQESIHVHGHWTIEVRNQDGTLATHREFENSLTTSGGGILVGILAGTYLVGHWYIILNGSSGAAPCAINSSNPNFVCVLTAGPELPSQFPGSANTLTLSTPSSGPYSGDLVLSGSFTAPTSGSFTDVGTGISLCTPSSLSAGFSSSACAGQSGSDITGLSPAVTATTIQSIVLNQPKNTPISVAAGQLVQVTVAIGFM